MPRVSVALPVFNGARHVRAAVQSILRQTLPDFEVLVIDDGSTDETASIVAALAAGDARLRVVRQERLGLVAALNRGLEEARAPYVARMDADDVAWPDRLARQVAALDASPGVVALGTACRVVDEAGRPLRELRPPVSAEALHSALDARNCIVHPTVMMRRGAVLACGGYRPAFVLAEDYDLWLRLRERHCLATLDAVLLDYREHSGQSGWRGLEQRIFSEIGAQAAATRRASGLADGADGPAPMDPALLQAMGVDAAALARRIIARAMGAAKNALAAGQPGPARAAVRLGLRQPGLRLRTRANLWLLGFKASAGRRPGWQRRRSASPDD